MLGGIIGDGRAVVFELDQTIAPLDVRSVGKVRTHAQILVEHFTILVMEAADFVETGGPTNSSIPSEMASLGNGPARGS